MRVPARVLDILVPFGLSALLLGFVVAVLLLPGQGARIEVFDSERWIDEREDARTDVRTDRRELLKDLRLGVVLPGLTMAEVRALLGEPDFITGPASDGLIEWIYPIAKDRVGSEDLFVLVVAVRESAGIVESWSTDVRRPPLAR